MLGNQVIRELLVQCGHTALKADENRATTSDQRSVMRFEESFDSRLSVIGTEASYLVTTGNVLLWHLKPTFPANSAARELLLI
jgi:hypothetical protein